MKNNNRKPNDSEENDLSKNFYKWLIINKKYFLFIPSTITLAVNAYGSIFKTQNDWIKDINLWVAFTAALQCLFILFAIFLPVKEKLFQPNPNKKMDETLVTANDALMKFKSAWTFLWTSWFLLYFTLFMKYFLSSDEISKFMEIPKEIFSGCNLQVFLNLFNNSSAIIFIICYTIFGITVGNESLNLKRLIVILLIILFLLGIIDFHSEKNNEVIKWGSSIFAGIAMAFFLGRLNNKFINPSIFVIVCLYAYMAIQTLFPFWSNPKQNFIVLLSANLAFIFKIVLYLFMLWLFRYGRLLFYFVNERELIQKQNIDRILEGREHDDKKKN